MPGTIDYIVRMDPFFGPQYTGTLPVSETGESSLVEASCFLGNQHPNFYDMQLTYGKTTATLRSEGASLDLDAKGKMCTSSQVRNGTFIHISPHVAALLNRKVDKEQVRLLEARLATAAPSALRSR